MMRVITGSARGRRLETLQGEDITRPTTESVKEALFSMIQFEIEDKKVLDLFAGSGQLGIEALSRGAKSCVFVENNKSAKVVVENNLKHCKLDDRASVILSDAISYLSTHYKDSFDIIFLDPPYKNGLIEKCMPKLIKMTNDNSIIICETSRDEQLPEEFESFKIFRERNYGKTKLTLYKANVSD